MEILFWTLASVGAIFITFVLFVIILYCKFKIEDFIELPYENNKLISKLFSRTGHNEYIIMELEERIEKLEEKRRKK